MIVKPGLLDHPKFLMLERAIGLDPLRILVRLWEHCEQTRKGGHWGPVADAYVEAVCRWDGEPGKLCKALMQGVAPGIPGWIERDEGGNLIVHDWDQENATLLQRWNARKSGNGARRSGDPSSGRSPDTSGDASSDTPIDREIDRGRGESDAAIPSLDEVVTYAEGAVGVHPGYARDFHAIKCEQHSWFGTGGRLVDWRKQLKRKWEDQRGWWLKKLADKERGLGEAAVADGELESIDAELQWQEDPARIEALQKRRKVLAK